MLMPARCRPFPSPVHTGFIGGIYCVTAFLDSSIIYSAVALSIIPVPLPLPFLTVSPLLPPLRFSLLCGSVSGGCGAGVLPGLVFDVNCSVRSLILAEKKIFASIGSVLLLCFCNFTPFSFLH